MMSPMMLDLLLTSLGLSLDACAVSVALSLRYKSKVRLGTAAFAFALFQALMPLLGYLVGLPFEGWVEPIDHWVAFLLLGGLGLKMLLEKEGNSKSSQSLSVGLIASLALATSLDAFAVGIGLHALGWNLLPSVACIGGVTLLLCLFGMIAGRYLHSSHTDRIEKIGGLVLIGLGIKILIEHLFF